MILFKKVINNKLLITIGFRVFVQALYKHNLDFMGIVQYYNTPNIWISLGYKKSFLSSWVTTLTGWTDANSFWYADVYYNNAYRTSIGVYASSTYSYYIARKPDEYRGRDCTIGSWDTRHCYIGSPPNGTTAFMWPDEKGYFYYTPVNGNQCPTPGSYYEGQNCVLMNIPSFTWGFIWNNSWYVMPDKIYN